MPNTYGQVGVDATGILKVEKPAKTNSGSPYDQLTEQEFTWRTTRVCFDHDALPVSARVQP